MARRAGSVSPGDAGSVGSAGSERRGGVNPAGERVRRALRARLGDAKDPTEFETLDILNT